MIRHEWIKLVIAQDSVVDDLMAAEPEAVGSDSSCTQLEPPPTSEPQT